MVVENSGGDEEQGATQVYLKIIGVLNVNKSVNTVGYKKPYLCKDVKAACKRFEKVQAEKGDDELGALIDLVRVYDEHEHAHTADENDEHIEAYETGWDTLDLDCACCLPKKNLTCRLLVCKAVCAWNRDLDKKESRLIGVFELVQIVLNVIRCTRSKANGKG